MSVNEVNMETENKEKLGLKENIILIILFCGIALMSNWASTGNSFLVALPGMAILFVMIIAGMAISAVVKGPLPVIAWVSIISVVSTLPFFPYSDVTLGYMKSLSFLPLATPVLAYAAMAVTDMEVKLFKQSGIKIVIISLLVFTGTYLGSALMAEAFL